MKRLPDKLWSGHCNDFMYSQVKKIAHDGLLSKPLQYQYPYQFLPVAIISESVGISPASAAMILISTQTLTP